MTHSLTFDAISEAAPGPKWAARWGRSWPAYKAWFIARGGDNGPDRHACEAALQQYMPELAPVHAKLTALAGGTVVPRVSCRHGARPAIWAVVHWPWQHRATTFALCATMTCHPT